ncbi:hypothetical protein JCM3766R1_004989 [Sporobolomyces carnicolor]
MSRPISQLSTSLLHAAPVAPASRNGVKSQARKLKAPRSVAANQARSFSCSRTISASSSSQPVVSRAPIPAEIVRSRSAVTEDIEGGEATTEDADADAAAPIDDYVPPPLSAQQLSLLYAYTAPPPLSALSAFAARISSNEYPDLADHLPLIEQCLIHESFWSGVDALPPTAHQRTYTNFHDAILPDSPSTTPIHASNATLAQVGNSLLGTLTTELLLSSFPNLPTRVTKAALTLYAGPKSLAQVAKSWGVGPSRLEKALVGREDEGKVSRKERAYGHLVGGRGGARKIGDEVGAKEGAAGAGLVRWNRKPVEPTKDAVLFEDALASVSRAVIGAVYQIHGFAAAKSFVHAHFLSRLLPTSSTSLPSQTASASILPLLKFQNPTRILSLQLQSASLPRLTHKLLKESGRLSAHPTFIIGAYSGNVKLGEGFGSSLKMAEWRASEDALRRSYLGGGRLDVDGKGFPSQQWADGEFEGWNGGVSKWAEGYSIPGINL